MQFYGPHKYQEQVAHIDIASGDFVAKGKATLDLGWLALTKKDNTSAAGRSARSTQNADLQNAHLQNEDYNAKTVLPALSKGESLQCTDSQLLEKQTSPPKHFTEATLLAAMTGIGRYVQDINIKKILKETDGLGTEATRASIIDLLFKRQFMQKVGKEVHATETGKALINALPSDTTHPDMTAIWEANLGKIAQRELRYDAFMQPLTDSIAQLISSSQQLDTSQFAGLKSAKPAGKKRFYKKKKA
jgi:DNA topoisomerase III